MPTFGGTWRTIPRAGQILRTIDAEPASTFLRDMNVAALKTLGLLSLSNVFMTFAWYGHLKSQAGRPVLIAILVSWGIAFFEYAIMVPANRIGHTSGLELGQLKIMQEVVTLLVFVPFALLYMGERWKWDYLWAFFCILGAVYFVFRK